MFTLSKTTYLVTIIALTPLSNTVLAQTGAIPVDIKGRILDLTAFPPANPIDLSEPFDLGSLKGAQVAFDLDNGNLVFFNTNPRSRFFSTYPMPGAAGGVNSIQYPASNYYFFSSVNDLGGGSGLVASNIFQPSGRLTIQGGSPATANIQYAGSLDNTLWFDRSVNTCPDNGICNPAELIAPLYSWADLSGGDVNACTPLAPSRIPQGRFVVITKRFGCDWAQRVRNIVSAGAIGWIIYDDQDGDDLSVLPTPNTPIPVVLIRGRDGAAVLDQLKSRGGSATATFHPFNLTASVSGTYTVGSDGKLHSVNLNLVVSTQFDSVFTGTLTTPQGATNLSSQGADPGMNPTMQRTLSGPMLFRPPFHSIPMDRLRGASLP
jgi:hypothetical protein